MQLKEKLAIAFRLAFAILLSIAIVTQFLYPDPNRFGNFARIVLWSFFLVMQIDYLIKKFRKAKVQNEQSI